MDLLNKSYLIRIELRNKIYNNSENIAVLIEYFYKKFVCINYNKVSSNDYRIDITIAKKQTNNLSSLDVQMNNYPIINNIIREYLHDKRIYSQLNDNIKKDLKELEPNKYILLLDAYYFLNNTLTIFL